MIERKKKMCKGGHLAYLFSHGYCKYHWNLIKMKEKKETMKPVADKDEKFYSYLWRIREHYCQNCGAELVKFDKDLFHHLLPKAKFQYFRHDERNVVLLCGKFGCHSKAESSVSYPKMNIFNFCEKRKAELMESVGLTYHSPYTKN